jgi:mono/diheme cytochrome c family protein
VRPSGHRAPAALALAAALAVLGAGCGREREPDLVAGKELFVQKCASCHKLKRANAQGGVQGPDLDEAFDTARREGMTEATVRGIVQDQIANVRRGSIMPANLVKGADALDVAAYVGRVAGQPGQDPGALASAGRPKVSKKPVEAENGKLAIDADPTGALAFTAVNALAPPGSLELDMENKANVQHNIAVRGGGLDEKGPVVGQGGVSKVKASLKPGKYLFYCSVPGHEAGGMKGNLTVK